MNGVTPQKGCENIKLRPYQTDIIEKLQNAWRDGHRRVLIQLPCGAGKTVVFAEISDRCQKRGKTVWFLVHRQELLKQTIDTFRNFKIPLDNVLIEMVGRVSRNPDKYKVPDLIVFDEAHFSMAETWRKIIRKFPEVYICGLTATPSRLDGKPLGEVYEKLVEGITAEELIEMKYLSKYRYYAPSVADLSGLNKKGSEYNLSVATDILNRRAIYGDVIKHYRKYADGLQTICYCSSIEHSQRMTEAFNDVGIVAEHFDGNTPKATRERIIEDFRSGKIQVLCNVDLISVGFDCPDCHCCILLRPTTSTALFIQQACRALRPAENKTAIILDCVNNYTRFGLPTDNREWSLDSTMKKHNESSKSDLVSCKECYCTYKRNSEECPYCGAEREIRKNTINLIEDAELKEIGRTSDEHLTKIRIFDCSSLKEMQLWCRANGKKIGYAWYVAKERGLVR